MKYYNFCLGPRDGCGLKLLQVTPKHTLLLLKGKRVKNALNVSQMVQKCPPSTFWFKNALNVFLRFKIALY